MVTSRETPEQQIAELEAKSKSEAQGLVHEQLTERLLRLGETKYVPTSKQGILHRAKQLVSTIEIARRGFLQTGSDKHLNSLGKLLRTHALLQELALKAGSKNWLQDSIQTQEMAHQIKEQELAAEHQNFEQPGQYNVNPSNINHSSGLTIERGAGGRGSVAYGSNRAKKLVQTANQPASRPNPSSLSNGNPMANKAKATNAAREVATTPIAPRFNHHGAPYDGAGPSSEMGTCVICNRTMPMKWLQNIQDFGLTCTLCETDHIAAANRADASGQNTRNSRKPQAPEPIRPRPVGPNSFFGNGGAQNQIGGFSRLGRIEFHQDRYNPLSFTTVSNGTGVLQGPLPQHEQQQMYRQQHQQQWKQAKRGDAPATARNPKPRTFQRKSGRQGTLNGVVVRKQPAEVIELGDTDEEDDDEESELEAALRAAAVADRSTRQRTTRLGLGVINASTVQRLQGLRCLMPPAGGPGAVEFTAADLGRLAPDEFLNDTAIDYYLSYLRLQLEKERPEDAQRCYFFNSFFYKKLTEKNAGGGSGGVNAAAAASYAKVNKWTRGVDIFAKDYVFVPIHDHLHWSLMIICHPGVQVPKITRKRPSSATALRNKKRSTSTDVVYLEEDEENPTIKAHQNASNSEDPIELEVEEEVDPRLAPLPEPFFLHLDSLSGGHSHESIAKTLKSYLKCEWDARISDPEAPEDSVPKKWLAEQTAIAVNKEKNKKKKPAAAADGDQVKKDGAGPSSPPIPQRFFTGIQAMKMNVPKQDNHCDCGLFVCAFVEFFIAALPKALNVPALSALKKQYVKDGIDLWEGTMRSGSDGEEQPAHYPGFLTKQWFKYENASNLRWELLKMVLHHMAEAVGIMDASGALTVDQAKKSITAEQTSALLEEIETAVQCQKVEGEYVRPDVWRFQGDEEKRKRAENRRRREEEVKDKELAAKLQKAEDERRFTRSKRKTVLEDSSDDNDDFKPKANTTAANGGGGILQKVGNVATDMFNKFRYKSSSELPKWMDSKPPGASTEDGPDADFGIDLDGDGDGSDGGTAGGTAPEDGKKEKGEEGNGNLEDNEIDICLLETVATAMGRVFAQGGDVAEAAKAAAAAVAATAPSPALGLAKAEGNKTVHHEEEGVEAMYEDDSGKELLDSLFKDVYGAGAGDSGGGGGNTNHAGKDTANPQPTNVQPMDTAKRLTMNPRRSKKGQQEANEALEKVSKPALVLIDSNQPPTDLDQATRCTIERDRASGKHSVVKSASLVLEYSTLPELVVHLQGKDALTKIHNWYLLWGKDLPETCDLNLPEGFERESEKTANKMKKLLQAQDAKAGAEKSSSLAPTEELPGQEDADEGDKEEETSPLKFGGKGKQAQGAAGGRGRGAGGRGGGGGKRPAREAAPKHFRFDDDGNAINEDEEIMIVSDEDDHPPPAKKQTRPAPAATGKRKNNKNINGNNLDNKPYQDPYEGDYAFVASQDPHEEQQRQKPKKQNHQRVSKAANKTSVSPRFTKTGARTVNARQMQTTTTNLKTTLDNIRRNNSGRGQKKAPDTVDLTR